MNDHKIYDFLRDARELGASDLHISPSRTVWCRIDGFVERPWADRKLNGAEIRAFLQSAHVGEEMQERLKLYGTASGSMPDLDAPGERRPIGPVRLTASNKEGGTHLALRLLALNVAKFDDLGLPAVMLETSLGQSGLHLFVGPTNHGKSTTMASVLQTMLNRKKKHLVTFESPPEYTFVDAVGAKEQTEIGGPGQPATYAMALAGALREDPDCILIGECLDPETMAAAIRFADTGRAVFTTLHALDAASVPDRIIGAFTHESQPQIRQQLANSLAAIYVMRLLPRKVGKGRVPAVEIMLVNDAIRAAIRDNKTEQIRNVISASGDVGMQTLEASISSLVYERGLVSEEVGREFAVHPAEVRAKGSAHTNGAPTRAVATGLTFK